MSTTTICIASGDGIGPEIMNATLRILEAVRAPLHFKHVEMGLALYAKGHSSGMTEEARATVEEIGILLKGPMETPKGAGVKSINVTARKMWSTYANKRVFRSLPGVDTVFSKAGVPIDLTLVRENIEDTYGGIEHMLTRDVALCRRFITRPGSERVHRYSFELARRNNLRQVTCGHKANIMKLTDGLFLDTFRRVAKEYPEIEANDIIVDDLAMKLVSRPDRFQLIVLPNLQGDILSDLCAGLVGGLGFAPSANVGDHVSIFEAVHGTAPDITGKGIANPSALLMSACMMLRHLHLPMHALAIEEALRNTLSRGVRTADFGRSDRAAVSTEAFTQEIISVLVPPVAAPDSHVERDVLPNVQRMQVSSIAKEAEQSQSLTGIDLFVESTDPPQTLAQKCVAQIPPPFELTMISNRGTQVWPKGSVLTDCVNQYRLRIELKSGNSADLDAILPIVSIIHRVARVCSMESLLRFGGAPAYSLAQGQ